MADPDRRTTIDGDQITDNTVTPSEFKTSNNPARWKALLFDELNDIMKWSYIFGNRILK